MKKLITILIALFIAVTSYGQIPYDKKLHAGAGVVIGAWGTFAGNSCEFTPEKSALFGMASATVAGIGKEIWDEIEYGGFDVKDLRATMIGGVIGAGVSYLGLKIFKRAKPTMISVNGSPTAGIKINF